jgi:hypothetical protein
MKALQYQVGPFITPREQPSIEMDLLEHGCIDETSELRHETPIHLTNILVRSPVHHVEIPT